MPETQQQENQESTKPTETLTLTTQIPDPEIVEEKSVQDPQFFDQNPPRNHDQNPSFLNLDQDDEDEDQDQETTTNSGNNKMVSISSSNPNSNCVTSPNTHNRKTYKRKKGKGVPNHRKLKKIEAICGNLRPVAFSPSKRFDFERYREVLEKLGLWEFVGLEFGGSVRVDLVAQLVGSYDSHKKSSYVNGFRIKVTRADLRRALRLPDVKVEKGGVTQVDLDSDEFSEESISFLEELVSSWMLLHGDKWEMPEEFGDWTRKIKDGHPDKVDWVDFIWYMVEKELSQGEKLRDCYYASHVQYLIKLQRPAVFGDEPSVGMKFEVREEGNDGVKGADDNDNDNDNGFVEEPNVTLSLGQDVEKQEQKEVKVDDMMDVEECEGAKQKQEDVEIHERMDVEECKVSEHEKKQEQGDWILNGKNSPGQHFLQPCTLEEFGGYNTLHGGREVEPVGVKEEEEVQEREDGYQIEVNDDSLDRDGLTGNLLQGMETQIPNCSQEEFHGLSSAELFASRDGSYMIPSQPSFFVNNSGKRMVEPDHDISQRSLNVSNKRLKTHEVWENDPSDVGRCMEQMQRLIAKTKMLYDEKERSFDELQLHAHYLDAERQQYEDFIKQLQKSKEDEVKKKDAEIRRLEHELFLLVDLVEAYKRNLKETRRELSEYRKRHPVPEERIYKDAGPGGLVLSTREIEKLRMKQEEEERAKMSTLISIGKNRLEQLFGDFQKKLDKVPILDAKLYSLEDNLKKLKEVAAQRIRTCDAALAEDDVNLGSSTAAVDLQDSVNGNDGSSMLPHDSTKLQDPVDGNDGCSKLPHYSSELQDPVNGNDGCSRLLHDTTELQGAVLENDGSLKCAHDTSESQNAPLEHDVNLANAPGATESQNGLLEHDVNLTNAPDATDSQNALLEHDVNLTNAPGATDSQNALLEHDVNLIDAPGATDSQNALLEHDVNLTDAPGATDSQNGLPEHDVSLTNAPDATESQELCCD